MPRYIRGIFLTGFLSLATVVAVSLKMWGTAHLTTGHISIEGQGGFRAISSDDNAERLRRDYTHSPTNIPGPVVNDSDSQLTSRNVASFPEASLTEQPAATVAVRTEQPAATVAVRAEQYAAATESVAVRNLSPTEKAPEKLYAAMADPPPGCQEAHCMEYLTASDKKAMKRCDDEVRKRYKRTPDDGSCNFMDGSRGRLPVALVSIQGSGNTWVRGLLERASGLCTGFNDCDFMMRGRGFIGEGIKSGSVLVVKTHSPQPLWHRHQSWGKPQSSKGFGSAIFILRNPYDSAIAEWHREATNMILIKQKIPHNESHTNVVASEYFTGEDKKFVMSETD